MSMKLKETCVRPICRSRGFRFDPYSVPSGSSWLHGADAYHPGSYRSGTLLAPPSFRASASTPSEDTSFARELLQLYTRDPAAFDAYAHNPDVRRSLNLPSELSQSADVQPYDDSYSYTQDNF